MMRSVISVSFFLFSLVVGSLINEETYKEPRKLPTVAGILKKILDDFEQNGFSVSQIDLGEDVGRFSNIRAEAVGKFEKAVQKVKTYGFDLKLNAEKITVSGSYDIQNIELPELFPIFGNGNFSVELEGLGLAIRTEVSPDFNTEKFKTKISNFSLSVTKSNVKFDNLMDDPDLADFLNELLSSLIPDIIQVLHKGLTPLLEFVVGYVMDQVIYCIKTEGLTEKFEECLRNITILGYDLPEMAHFLPTILTSLN